MEQIFEITHCENWFVVFVTVFYYLSVVGDVPQNANVITGGMTHSTVQIRRVH